MDTVFLNLNPAIDVFFRGYPGKITEKFHVFTDQKVSAGGKGFNVFLSYLASFRRLSEFPEDELQLISAVAGETADFYRTLLERDLGTFFSVSDGLRSAFERRISLLFLEGEGFVRINTESPLVEQNVRGVLKLDSEKLVSTLENLRPFSSKRVVLSGSFPAFVREEKLSDFFELLGEFGQVVVDVPPSFFVELLKRLPLKKGSKAVFLWKPNELEYSQVLSRDDSGELLVQKVEFVLLSKGRDGVSFIDLSEGFSSFQGGTLEVKPREVLPDNFPGKGAGDFLLGAFLAFVDYTFRKNSQWKPETGEFFRDEKQLKKALEFAIGMAEEKIRLNMK